MIASVAQIAWFKWKGKLSAIHWMSFAIIAVFGGATLWLKDDVFIRWKPSVLYGLFAAILVVRQARLRARS
jgi:intracellular septation protein